MMLNILMRRTRNAAGMTLPELLAAMAIFVGLAGMVMQVLGGGLDLWSSGERSRDETEQAQALLDRIGDELRHIVSSDGGDGEPRVKLLSDFVKVDADGDGQRDFRAQRMVFVRWLLEERTERLLRHSGTTSGQGIPFVGELRDATQGTFAATESLTEVALLCQPDVRPGYEGRMVLWRALRSPIGGKESLFAKALRDDAGLDEAVLLPLAENVLWFGLNFIDGSVNDMSAAPDSGGPLVVWDSTRGILPAGDGYSGFRHARGHASLEDPDDDVFPDAIRVVVIMALPPGESPSAETIDEIPSAAGSARVDLKNGQWIKKLGESRALKIGHEWVQASSTDGLSLTVTERGLYGTAGDAHPPGTKVQIGRRFERIVPLPARRFDLVQRDLQRNAR